MPHQSSPLRALANTALPVAPLAPISQHTASRLYALFLPGLAVLLSAMLSACGGGKQADTTSKVYTATCSDGSIRTSNKSQTDAQNLCVPIDSSLQNWYAPILTTAPPDPGYVDAQKVVYDIFNKARGDCGFGYITRNTKLDQAATAHANYNVVNNVFGHYEVAGKPGFTGVDSWARNTAAGYANYAPGTNEVGNVTSVFKVGDELVAVTSAAIELLAAPYHMAGILGNVGQSEIGIGVQFVPPVRNLTSAVVFADYGTPLGGRQQSLAAGDVRTYPCEGTTGTAYQLDGEDPNPVPGRILLANPIGQPIFVMVARGHVLSIVSVTLTGPDGAVLAVLPTLNSSNDTTQRFLEPHYAIIMPDKPMLPMTKYSVLINGKDNNQPFTRQFSFTTGNTY